MKDKAYIGDEIVEGNKLIADFMGWVYFGHNDPRLMIDETIYVAGWKRKATNHQYGKGIFKQYLCRNHSQLAYHSSWDWLMPVWYKFRLLDAPTGLECELLNLIGRLAQDLAYEEITIFHKNLVLAITWYNKNKQS